MVEYPSKDCLLYTSTGLLCYLRDEQRQSSFKPVACELKIGPGEDAVRGQTYRLSDGRTVQLIGTVDRADEWIEDDGTRWVRVVDYKTCLLYTSSALPTPSR